MESCNQRVSINVTTSQILNVRNFHNKQEFVTFVVIWIGRCEKPIIDFRSPKAPNMTDSKTGNPQQTSISIEARTEDAQKLPQYIAGLSATIGALAAGLVIGWSSPAGDGGSNLVYPFPIDEDEFYWLSSMFTLGAAAICLLIGMLTDLVGRRGAMLFSTLPFVIGWACVIWPSSVGMLIFGRFLLGLSGGSFCVTVPIYTAEIADSETRGRLGSYFELLLCTGILIAYALGLLNNMYLLSLISASVPLIFFAIFYFMPETPTYHLMKGDINSARKTLIWLRGRNYGVESELEEKMKCLAEAELNKVSFFVAIRSKVALKGLVIGYGLMFFQQLSGINAIIFYGGNIIAAATGGDPTWPIIYVATAQVSAVFLSTVYVDKWGRRVILLMSSTIMCLAHVVLGVYFYLDHVKYSVIGWTWVPVVCICGFVVSMEFGFGPIPWMMMGEIFSPRIRGVAGSSAGFFNWMMAFIVTRFYNDVRVQLNDHGTFWMFSAICALSIVFVVFLVPETKGKSLEQIQIELGGDLKVDERTSKKRKTENKNEAV